MISLKALKTLNVAIPIVGVTTPVVLPVIAHIIESNIIRVSSVEISGEKEGTMIVGETKALTAKVSPENASDKKVSWTSQDSLIAEVDSNGLVLAKNVGKTIITVTTHDGGFIDNYWLVVKPKIVPVTDIKINEGESGTLEVGRYGRLTVTITPEDATDNGISWTSSNEKVAWIDSSGKICAESVGETVITVKSHDGGFTDTYRLTVFASVTGVKIKEGVGGTLEVGQTQTLTAEVTPEDAADKTVSWKSSDKNVATVDANGTVTAVSEGTAIITVTTHDGGFTDTYNLTVNPKPIPVKGITIQEGEGGTLPIGQTQTLTVKIEPEDATDKDVSWKSSNSGVATVDKNGTITAVSEGNATITVTTHDGEYTDTYNLTVVIPVASVTIKEGESGTLLVGQTRTLTPVITPEDASDKTVSWESNNESVATVDNNGIITAISEGNAVITVTTHDGGFTASYSLAVEAQPIPVTGVSILEGEEGTLEVDQTQTLTAKIEPADATDQHVSWASNNESVATVNDKGTITAVSEGSAAITVTTHDGEFTATYNLTVTPKTIHVTGVEINEGESGFLEVGKTQDLTTTITPQDATDKVVSWKSDDEDIATVDANGTITAVSEGTTTITVTTHDGGFTDTYEITVVTGFVPVTGVEINEGESGFLEVGKTQDLTTTITPQGATDQDVSWASSKEDVATVDANGTITAVSEGTTTITVTTHDGGFTDTYELIVVAAIIPVTDITIKEGTSGTITTRDTLSLTAEITPKNATDQTVLWESSDPNVATVNQDGLITAVSKGTTTITAISRSNPSLKATYDLTVSQFHSFSEDNWSTVLQHANNGLEDLKATYKLDTIVGQERTLFINGYNYPVQVIGENEDYLVDADGNPQLDKPVALTFMFKTVYQERTQDKSFKPGAYMYPNSSGDDPWDYDEDLWNHSLVRWLMNDVLLPWIDSAVTENSELQGVKNVSKRTICVHGSGATQSQSEYVFLPSLADFFSSEEDNYQLPPTVKGLKNSDAYEKEGNVTSVQNVYKRYSLFDQTVTEPCLNNQHPELAISDGQGGNAIYWLRSCKPTTELGDWSEWIFSGLDNTFQDIMLVKTKSPEFAIAPIFCI